MELYKQEGGCLFFMSIVTLRVLQNYILPVVVVEQTAQYQKKKIRVWMDGVFDLMHYGHMNAFRQAKCIGDILIVGINSDESVIKYKGTPVFDEKERLQGVYGCKWVDEVVENVPYIMDTAYIHYIIEKYDIDYIIHGDDPCIINGQDVYATAKAIGKYRNIPRTEGISTTEIVGRILKYDGNQLSQQHESQHHIENIEQQITTYDCTKISSKSNFLVTSNILNKFIYVWTKPSLYNMNKRTTVYMSGYWDLYRADYVALYEIAKQYGDYLIIGVHSDQNTAKHDVKPPIMTSFERYLSVLGCKYIDDVLFDAPLMLTQDIINTLGINVVVYVEGSKCPLQESVTSVQTVEVSYIPTLTDDLIVSRIKLHDEVFQQRYLKKKTNEDQFYKDKYSRVCQ